LDFGKRMRMGMIPIEYLSSKGTGHPFDEEGQKLVNITMHVKRK